MKGLLRVPPTKSTLLSLRRQVAALPDGHDLLERKRELLTRLVHQRLRNYRELRKKVGEALQGAYHWLSIAQMRMGITQLQQAVVGLESPLSVYILPRSSVGVEYPTVTVETAPLQPSGRSRPRSGPASIRTCRRRRGRRLHRDREAGLGGGGARTELRQCCSW